KLSCNSTSRATKNPPCSLRQNTKQVCSISWRRSTNGEYESERISLCRDSTPVFPAHAPDTSNSCIPGKFRAKTPPARDREHTLRFAAKCQFLPGSSCRKRKSAISRPACSSPSASVLVLRLTDPWSLLASAYLR